MRRFYLLGWIVFVCGALAHQVQAGEYHLTNGDVIKGEPSAITEDGVIFKLDIGGFSHQVRWAKFTQESLKELAQNPKAARFAEAFIDAPPETKQQEKKKKDITVRPIEHPPHYERVGFLAAWTTPAALMILLVLYAANLYAAFQVAQFRNRPPRLVCGVSAVLPVFGPLLFLSLPTLDESGVEIQPEPAPAEAAVPLPQGARAAEGASGGGGLGLAKAAKTETASGATEPGVYKRGDFTFNRRFIETKFANFFRVIPSDDMVLVVRTNRNEFVAKRISRISANEMHVQLLRGGVEQSVPFADVLEFQVRPKEG